jgi:hypothetical protein
MADKPLATRDLVESILELRGEVERRLMRNKYFLALKKLDELLEAIRPLEAEVIEEEGPEVPSPSLTGAGSPSRDASLQQRLTAETTAATAQRHDWDRETETPAPEPAKTESDWAASEQTTAIDDTLVLDERHERPAETRQFSRESSELLADDDEQFMYRAERA